jgi:hypothetical protein
LSFHVGASTWAAARTVDVVNSCQMNSAVTTAASPPLMVGVMASDDITRQGPQVGGRAFARLGLHGCSVESPTQLHGWSPLAVRRPAATRG